jgi:ABC-type branched-subunit amino acid transport system ATPase component/branched-subunit amino acid ABC-type transport system permease component
VHDILPFFITGLLTGTIYGLAATGLVLTYKTSGIFNFGYGAILTAGALLYYRLTVTYGWDWKPAFFVSVFVAGPVFGLMMEFIARRLSRQRTEWKIVGTVGIMVLIPALCLVLYPESTNGLQVERFLPFNDRQKYKVTILDVNVFGDQILVAAIAVLSVAGLYVLFRFTRLGAQMRAAVDDPDLLDLTGTSPSRVRRIAWIIGCTFACLSGVLILPSVGLQPYTLTFLATYAFGAAALGAFTSIPITFLGGLAIGVAADLSGYIIGDRGWESLNGLPEALPFLILFVALLVLPSSKLSPRSDSEARPPLRYHGPIELRLGVAVILLVLLAVVPMLFETKISYFVFGLCQAILILSLGLLVKTSGQISLCHATFAAIGGVAFSQFHVEAGLPWWIAFACAALVCVPVGAIVALPAIRLHGVYLALATFGFGILVQRLFFPQSWMFFTFAGSRAVPRPFGITSMEGYYYFVLAVLVIVSVLVASISEARIGRLLRGMSDAPTAMSTLGLSTNVTKMIVFCVSAALAGVAGILYGGAYSNIDSGTPVYSTFNSLVLVAILALAPFREPWYAVFAGVTAVIPGFFTGDSVTYWLSAIFGFFAILVAIQGGQPPMSPKLAAALDRIGSGRRARVAEHPVPAVLDGQLAADGSGLEVGALTVSFGGLRAIDSASFEAPIGRITGLIGPNGAGKTTAFNAISGINRNISGAIVFDGKNILGEAPPSRGRMGLGRTFQKVELGDSLTVFDNVQLGAECGQAGSRVVGQMVAPSRERLSSLAAAHDAMSLCGISHLAGIQAGALSTGQRRLVELARCLAGRFDLLLLDEPSSGLDHDETERFGEILQHVVAERGCGILLVEHDMSLVMKICAYIYVLDFGHMIFEGTPGEVARSDIVRAAYLGTEAEGLEADPEDIVDPQEALS